MASTSDLCELADVKAWLNITAAADDALLQRLITASSVFMQNWMNRTFATAPYAETRDGSGSDTLVLANTPVTAVSSLTVGGIAQGPSPDGIQPGYVFSDTAVYLIGSSFPAGRRNVAVTYTAGYTTVPQDLAQGCIDLVGWAYRGKQHIGQTGTGMGPEHISFSLKDMPDSTKTVMNQYKKVVPI